MSNLLNAFGELLIRRVRDSVVERFDMIFAGSMRSESALRDRVLPAFRDDPEALRLLVRDVVDSVLHHLLSLLDEDESLELQVRPVSGAACSVKDESDGLAGELYGRRGWIAKFSRYPPSV